jgi:hypothetical protein
VKKTIWTSLEVVTEIKERAEHKLTAADVHSYSKLFAIAKVGGRFLWTEADIARLCDELRKR